MANHTYYTRLNFQTQPLAHDQVSSLFKQSYLQRDELIHSFYGPIYNFLMSYFFDDSLEQRTLTQFQDVLQNRAYLLINDAEFYYDLKDLCEKMENWNSAIEPVKCRVANLIRHFSSKYFNIIGHCDNPNLSNMSLNIKTELTSSYPKIDVALLNKKHPLKFWQECHPFEAIIKVRYLVQYVDSSNNVKSLEITEQQFNSFFDYVQAELSKDNLVIFVREELEKIHNSLNNFMVEIEQRTR